MILKNNFLEVEISEYGASIVSIKLPDKNGDVRDVVLGYDDLEKYKRQTKYIGATVGRCCNRIKNGIITLNGKNYKLNCNDGENHLHGGVKGFDKKFWQGERITNGVRLYYNSKDGEENYPGNLKVCVTYTLNASSLRINYHAISDKTTVCNLTNHTYFNLNGKGDILNQKIKINADYFTENDTNSLTTGKIIPVKNTPMDFRRLKAIGKDIESSYYQIEYANGFDNNWVLNNSNNEKIRKAACAFSKESGIELTIYTDLPGIQFYSGNYLDGTENGKNNIPIKKHSGFCLECQYFPNSFANENFEKPILHPDEIYNKTIIYKFKTKYNN